MSEILTPQESVRLCELERVIQKGKDTFVEVGAALAEIRDKKLYRPKQTFEEYCEQRWEMGKSHVNRLMEAARIVEALKTSPMGEVAPTNERQARPLAKLPAEQQPAAGGKAQEIAKEEGKPVAARHVEAAVAEIMPKQEVGNRQSIIPDRRPSSPKFIPDDADRLWTLAHMQLEKILPADKSRERVLREAIAYCETRISETR